MNTVFGEQYNTCQSSLSVERIVAPVPLVLSAVSVPVKFKLSPLSSFRRPSLPYENGEAAGLSSILVSTCVDSDRVPSSQEDLDAADVDSLDALSRT